MKKIGYLFLFMIASLIEVVSFSQTNTSVENLWNQIKGNVEYKNRAVYSIDSIYVANKTIKLMYGEINTPNYDAKIFFIDDEPGVYWSHPCRIIFCNPLSLKLETVSLKFPPKNLKRMKQLTPKREIKKAKLFDYSSFKNEVKLNNSKLKSTLATSGNDYAVIISGGSVDDLIGNSIINSCEVVYMALKSKYGYPDANIYTLIGNGNNYGMVNVDYAATLSNLSLVFDELKTKVTSNDRVFIYCMDHGDNTDKNTNRNSLLCIYNELLPDYTLASEVNKITPKSLTVVMGQCSSGGFVDNLSGPNRIIMTACNWNEKSYPTPDNAYSEFTYNFVSAVTGTTPSGTTVSNSDENEDRYISIREAYYFAKNMDRIVIETPQYNSRPADLGKITTLNSSDATINLPIAKPALNLDFISDIENRSDCDPIKSHPESFRFAWKVSHGSPNLNPSQHILNLQAECPLLYDSLKSEGVFISYNFLGGHKYSFEVNGNDSYTGAVPSDYFNEVFLEVKAASGLTETTYEGCDKKLVPSTTNSKEIYGGFGPRSSIPTVPASKTFDFTFGADDKYNQLWVYAHQRTRKSIGQLELSHIAIVDKGVDVPASKEEVVYTPVPSTNANAICCEQQGIGSLDPAPLIGTQIPGTFNWEKSYDEKSWSTIPDATDCNYDPPTITRTTYYKRWNSNPPYLSNEVKINVAPNPLEITNVSISPTRVIFTWNPFIDYDGHTVEYDIYRDNKWVGTTSQSYWIDSNIEPGKVYKYNFAAWIHWECGKPEDHCTVSTHRYPTCTLFAASSDLLELKSDFTSYVYYKVTAFRIKLTTGFKFSALTPSHYFDAKSVASRYWLECKETKSDKIDTVYNNYKYNHKEYGTDNVLVYPNPTNGVLNIDIAENNYEVLLLNNYGQFILRKQNAKELDLSEYPSGMYVIKIRTVKWEKIKKIIKN